MSYRRPRAAEVYILMAAVQGTAMSVVYTLSQVYRVTTVGLNPLQLVLVGTVMELTVLLFEVPTGVVADTYGRRISVLIGFVLMGLGHIAEGAVPLFLTVLAAQVIWGIGATFVSGARDAWIADEVGVEAAGPIYLRGAQARMAGSLIGVPFGVALGWERLNVPFFAGGALLILLAVTLTRVMPEQGFRRPPGDRRAGLWTTAREGLGLIRARPPLASFLAIGLFLGLYSEGYDRLREAHLLQDLTLPALGELSYVVWFGVLRAGSLLLTLGATELARRRLHAAQGTGLLGWLLGIYGSIVFGLLAFAAAPAFGVALLASWMVDALRATAIPIQTAWLNLHIDSRVRATVLSTFGQVDALGEILGGPVLGLVGTLRSIRTALFGSALMLTPVLPLFARTIRRDGDAEVREDQRPAATPGPR